MYNQNVALKKDMAEMLAIVSKLREENETYRQNFENVCPQSRTPQHTCTNVTLDSFHIHDIMRIYSK
jgi:hypothetical protein